MTERGCAGRRPISSATITKPKSNRTQLLRQAKAIAVATVPESNKNVRNNKRARTGLAKVGPPPSTPRRVDFTKPAPTRAMLARQAKTKADEERRRHEEQEAISRKRFRRQKPTKKSQKNPEKIAEDTILEKSIELAESGKAEIIEAIALKDGPVDTIIIPPGIAREDQSIIVRIKSYEETSSGIKSPMNKSIQALSRSLYNQETTEVEAVQSKLDEFQQARREFVMELANVAATPGFDPDTSILDVNQMYLGSFENISAIPQKKIDHCKTRVIYPLPDPESEMFHVPNGLNHPAIIAVKDFLIRTANVERQRALQQDENCFAKVARQLSYSDNEFDLEESLMQDIADISFEEDEDGEIFPCQSRIKASMPKIPRKSPGQRLDCVDVDELERFFNIEQYPGRPFRRPSCPPPGREDLNPDLWELDDPWFREPPQSDFPDLMHFSSDLPDLMQFSP